jgi:hypothetical protein
MTQVITPVGSLGVKGSQVQILSARLKRGPGMLPGPAFQFEIALQDLGDHSPEASGWFLSARHVKCLVRVTFWPGCARC